MGEGVVKDGSGVMFVVVYYCLSFEGCKPLLGTGAALLSTWKLQVSTGCIRQAMREMSQVLSLKSHLLFRNTISCKARLTVECWKMQGALAAGVTFVPREPFTLSFLFSIRNISSKLA